MDNLNESIGDDPNAVMGHLVMGDEKIPYDSLGLTVDDDCKAIALHVNGFHTVTRAMHLILKTCLFQPNY